MNAPIGTAALDNGDNADDAESDDDDDDPMSDGGGDVWPFSKAAA
jgi:hypothetical protein